MIDPMIILVLNVTVLHGCANVPHGTACASTYDMPHWYTGSSPKYSETYLFVVRKVHQNEPDLHDFFLYLNGSIRSIDFYSYATWCEGDCENVKSEYRKQPFVQNAAGQYTFGQELILQKIESMCGQNPELGCYLYGEAAWS